MITLTRIKDETGNRYGMLTAVCYSRSVNKLVYWQYQCDCGKMVERSRSRVASAARLGRAVSCGCMISSVRANNGHNNRTHGWSRHRLYGIWRQMHDRCQNEKNGSYEWYGARGISVCEEWSTIEDFAEWAMSNGYGDRLTIERSDVNGSYCPSNCRWIPNEDQALNTRRNRFLELGGVRAPVSWWARQKGLSPQTLLSRLRYGWSDRDAIEGRAR